MYLACVYARCIVASKVLYIIMIKTTSPERTQSLHCIVCCAPRFAAKNAHLWLEKFQCLPFLLDDL